MSESLRVHKFKIWLDQAESDYKAAVSSQTNGFFNWATYQSVQSVEKVLKGIIALSGALPPKTHKLSVLYKIVKKSGLNLGIDITELRKLEAYTYLSRYPFLNPYSDDSEIPSRLIGLGESSFSTEIAERLIRNVKNFVENNSELILEMDESAEYWDREFVQNLIDSNLGLILSNPKYQVSKVVLYGSFARDLSQLKSKTMDILIIIKDSNNLNVEGFVERTIYFNELLKDSVIPIDCLVYTESEYQKLMNVLKDGYIEETYTKGRILFGEKI